MSQDTVLYLNGENAYMGGSLVSALQALPAKLLKAPSKEWMNTLKSLASKGQVKQAEIDDSEILVWLGRQTGTVTREELIKAATERKITIKEVTLGRPMYKRFSHERHVPGGVYNEVLFIANSERANVEDRIEQIEWELEQFNFDMERLSEDPDAVFRLTQERAELMDNRHRKFDFTWSHFVREDIGRHGKNLIGHARELSWGNIFLIEEIQSDWGQRGRRDDWRSIPKGPFVTDTKLWAGLAMRRMMQRAANNPNVERVYWIRGSMSNGAVEAVESQHDDFYFKTIPGIADRLLAGTGMKSRFEPLKLGEITIDKVPCFDMTPAVREKLSKTIPLYSLSRLLPLPQPLSAERKRVLMEHVAGMIGSTRTLRLLNHLYDVAQAREVAGSYINGMVQASLRADNLEDVLNHECFHFGMDKLFSAEERRMVLRDFAPGTELNTRITKKLALCGELAAASQCSDAEEAAAYAFAFWSRGQFSMEPAPARTLFEELRGVVADTFAWFRRTVLDEKVTTTQELFEAFLGGAYGAAKERQNSSALNRTEGDAGGVKHSMEKSSHEAQRS
jgi:hypothetical protein